MASNSGWSKGLPSGGSALQLGDNDIRSNNSVLQAAWEDEHYFTDGSASSAGVHKTGSARAYSQAAAPTAIAPKGQLWHDTDDNSLFIHDGASWVTLSTSIAVGSQQTWTALQEFSGGVEASDLSVTGVFSGWTSYSTFTDLASIASNNVITWIATDGVASNVTKGDFLVFHRSGDDALNGLIWSATASAGSITLRGHNANTGALNPSAQTYTVFIYKGGHPL